MPPPKSIYAIRKGAKLGLFTTWDECKPHVLNHKGAEYKKFKTVDEAVGFLKGNEMIKNGEIDGWVRGVGGAVSGGGVKRKVDDTDTNEDNATSTSTSTSSTTTNPKKRKSSSPLLGDPSEKTLRKVAILQAKSSLHRQKRDLTTSTLTSTTTFTTNATFTINPTTQRIIIYTDGSCRGNGREDPQAGIGVFFGYNHPLNLSERLPGSTQTNQRAEIFAVIRALEVLAIDETNKNIEKLPLIEIRTDSKYVVNAVNDWIPKWLTNDYKNNTVLNKDLFERLVGILGSRNTKVGMQTGNGERRQQAILFVHVRGHSSEEGNDMADKLAVKGSYLPRIL